MRTPWGRESTTTYRLDNETTTLGPGLYLRVDHLWDTDCAGSPLVLERQRSALEENARPSIAIRPDEARELRDTLSEWLAEWDAIVARVGGES
jgi:hypothetical protein